MSTGGVFTLISNNGIQDKLIMAIDQLLENIKLIGCNKLGMLKQQFPNLTDEQLIAKDNAWMPTLAAIEKTHILFVNAKFKPFVAMAHEYSKTIASGGTPNLGNTFNFKFPIIGEFINDAILYVKLSGFHAVSALDKVRYVEYLGHRICKKVSFKVQNFEIDSYGADNLNAYYQFRVPTDKQTGYLRNIGQEIPSQAFLTANPPVDEIREYRWFGYGPQTFKQTQPDVELWIPVLFWFKDLQTSLPNFILPMQQTGIEVTFESEQNLVAFADYGGGGKYAPPQVTSCYLYLNHIFLLPEINKIFITRFGFQLIRVHRAQRETLIESGGRVLLHNLKWPLECLYVGFRPQSNLSQSQLWHRMTSATSSTFYEAVVTGTSLIQVNQAEWWLESPVIQNMSLSAMDIIIYPTLSPTFYNSYIPYRYGPRIRTPNDVGWMMINFNFYPGEYQPSGHFNCSRSRELYLSYLSNLDSNSNYIISPNNPVDLVVLADAINFLLYKDGNMTLRFST